MAAHGGEVPARPPAPPRVPRGRSFHWLDPSRWPAVPIPNISIDPTNGAVLGIIPTWLQHDPAGHVVRIIAPDIVHNSNFGIGGHARILDFPSADTAWSVVAGMMQRVESRFDAQYATGLLRARRWSSSAELGYDRSGTARFFGVGNDTPYSAQSVYTDQQLWLTETLGWNITRAWQIGYTLTVRKVRVSGGRLPGVASITDRFPDVRGLGTTREVLHRVSVAYDTRDSVAVPTRGVDWVVYGGVASRNGTPDASLFSEAGVDGRLYWSPTRRLTVAAHVDLRYMPSLHAAPFWALSSVGGDSSVLGGQQTLRGFVDSRFYDRNALSVSLELRQAVLALEALGTRLVLQVAPFYDGGRVFCAGGTHAFEKLHNVFGVGFRGVAAPFIVGYVDVGYGSEGMAVYTGVGYPF